jgi:hypothetical protein
MHYTRERRIPVISMADDFRSPGLPVMLARAWGTFLSDGKRLKVGWLKPGKIEKLAEERRFCDFFRGIERRSLQEAESVRAVFQRSTGLLSYPSAENYIEV